MGTHDHVQMRESLQTKTVKVYLHDCEQYTTETDVIFSHGRAQFTFRDFLSPYTRELKLRSEVLPTKRIDIEDPQNLDLNTTAKKGERGQDKLNPYLMNNTYCVIKANLAYPILAFDET